MIMKLHNNMKTVKTFTWDDTKSIVWMLGRNGEGKANTIDKFMASVGPALLNPTRKEVETLGKRFIRINFRHWNASARNAKASCVFTYMVKNGNLLETGSKIVA